MQSTKRIAEVARIVGVSKYTIEQWISRGYFESKIEVVPGQVREWTVTETARLVVFAKLVGAGMEPKEAGSATPAWVHGFKDAPAFLVSWTGETELATQPPIKVRYPGFRRSEIVRKHVVLEYMEDKSKDVLIVLCLDHVEELVKSKWDDQDTAG